MSSKENAIRTGRLLMRVRPAPLAAMLKKILGVQRLVAPTVEGTFWVDPASYQGLRVLESGVYEPEMLATLRRFLKPGDIFADVGANEGYFSVVASRLVGPAGRVLAVEPQKRLEPVLRRNFELNHSSNVTLVAAAVSDRPGESQIHLTPGMNNSASSLMQPTRYPLARQTVRTATLAEILREAGIERCALLKIDIEGWEYEAVLGSRSLFAEGRVAAIALELHPHLLAARGLDGGDITRFLADCGYRAVPEFENLVLARENPPAPGATA
jgi:FkbM family methyltransferase